MYYDLHIHSCLSPCAEDEMTPNNICNMAKLKGLDLIAVSDHNSCLQQPAMKKTAEKTDMHILYGAELQSREEVHVLGLFGNLEQSMVLQKWLDEKLPAVPNSESYFGKQEIKNDLDETVNTEKRLLLVSLNASLEECIEEIHQCGGKAFLAHVLDRENSVTNQLGFIPQNLNYDGLEIKSEEQKQRVMKMHPWIHEDSTVWLNDSDAHRLVDISEAEHQMDPFLAEKLWGIKV